jgi:hypothetical protein
MICQAVLGSLWINGASISISQMDYLSIEISRQVNKTDTNSMLMVATVLQGKRYGWFNYLAALCVGATGYAMDLSVPHGPINNASVPGLVLLILSIMCDALIPNLQQQWPFSMTPPDYALSATELMVNANAAVNFSGLLVYMLAMGQLMEGIVKLVWSFPVS